MLNSVRNFNCLLVGFAAAVPTITFEDAPEAIQRGVKMPRKTVLNKGIKIAEVISDGKVFIYRSSVDQFKWKAYRRDPFIQDVANYLLACHS
jgi:hypothetical protein